MLDQKINHHYVPQFYLKQWANDKNQVHVYRRLVSHENVPFWTLKSVRGVASQPKLYSRYLPYEDVDEFENWLEHTYETPVQDAFLKAISNKKLSYDEWHKLIDFTASQIVRTPGFYFKCKEMVGNIFNNICKNSVPQWVQAINDKYEAGTLDYSRENETKNDDLTSLIDAKVIPEKSAIKLSCLNGRDLWLATAKRSLIQTSKILHQHKWSIITMHEDITIPTSDNPVLCLNYNNENDYDFGGGWGYKGSEIIFPLSPLRIMYTQIGKKRKSNLDGNLKLSLGLQKLILEHSHRFAYSNIRIKRMLELLPREVNKEKYEYEEDAWNNWHENQKPIISMND